MLNSVGAYVKTVCAEARSLLSRRAKPLSRLRVNLIKRCFVDDEVTAGLFGMGSLDR